MDFASLRRIIGKSVLVVLGLGFTFLWLAAHAVWAMASFMGNMMMNDSGRMPNSAHNFIVFGCLFGQGIAALAGIPGGLAFFLSEIRRPLLKWFGGLFLLGALIQIALLAIGLFGYL